VWLFGALCVASAGLALQVLSRVLIGCTDLLASLLQALLLGFALKPLLAWRMLLTEVQSVESALQESLPAARMRLRNIVSRDTEQLTPMQVRESALESLAENLNDSFVAPLFWFVVGGLPGAALYRFANTADAMWGYRGRYEWAGKWSARADDALSYIPARLSAALLAIVSGRWPARLFEIAKCTPSPNSGWPMGMLALAIGVRLTKPGAYVLNDRGHPVELAHFNAALRLCRRTAAAAGTLAVVSAAAIPLVIR
jgi:adenosylcobinamide-phosphate synthase